MTDPTFVFLHIDKTGGMALRDLLAAQFPRDAIRPVPHSTKVSYQPTAYPIDPNDDLIYHNRTFRMDYNHRLVMGHYDYDIIEHITGDVVIITVLRDPMERAASLWRYICRETRAYPQLSVIAKQMGPVDFLDRYRVVWSNVMAQQLAGDRWSRGHGKRANGALMENDAIRNLSKFEGYGGRRHHVGITEQLSAFTTNLCSKYNWHGELQTVNATDRTPIDPQLHDLVALHSPHDVALYNIAKERCYREI
jgi:hypothetical protein